MKRVTKIVVSCILSMVILINFSLSVLAGTDNNYSHKINAHISDSGWSAMPEDSPMQRYAYATFAPKTQTKYKTIYTTSTSVKKLKLINKKILAVTSPVGSAISLTGPMTMLNFKSPSTAMKIIGKYSKVATVVSFTSEVINIKTKREQSLLNQFKKNSKVVTKVYFKWTDPKSLKYAVKITSYVTYKGKKVSKSYSSEMKSSF